MGDLRQAEPHRLVELDGRVGEGGGQLVRVAVALSAITGTPIRIHHVRANRLVRLLCDFGPSPAKICIESEDLVAEAC